MATGHITIHWSLVVECSDGTTDPDNMLEASKAAIASAIEDGEISGEVTERVMWDEDRMDTPPGVTPDADEATS